ncbi:hypothetical protein ACSL103130_01270 [Actinomyces slackii]|uniref:TIR domain-containing protein n=1 Tax=Actinomyces slackii TaxID=52774 RepID=A0A3S4UPT8_9ACTO|nr:hypothetical protein [Actinomyces slackii]VEG75483.1 Uncharacterised protein [Actinomyces slackii]
MSPPSAPTPSILDIFVVWNPKDRVGERVFSTIYEHYHSEAYSGLAGGAIDVYARSEPAYGADKPLPIPVKPLEGSPSTGQDAAEFTVILPVIGVHLMEQASSGPWAHYIVDLLKLRNEPDDKERRRIVVPILQDGVSTIGAPNVISELLRRQGLHYDSLTWSERVAAESVESMGALTRDLSQMIVQALLTDSNADERITVFLSHARQDIPEPGSIHSQQQNVVTDATELIDKTRLRRFLDIRDIQGNDDWHQAIAEKASTHALLMLRTDHYSSRSFTQWEVLDAKRADVPIVSLTALEHGESRGSFLMDHIPTIAYPASPTPPIPQGADHNNDIANLRRRAVMTALNALVDECLKRALWTKQTVFRKAVAESLSADNTGFDARPVHSPEPTTLAKLLREHREDHKDDREFWLIHPDPPLLAPEHETILDLCELAKYERNSVHILTPRTFLASGGVLADDKPGDEHRIAASLNDLDAGRPLAHWRLGLSMALSEDQGALGLKPVHLEQVVAEIAQLVLLAGGSVTYAGALGTHAPDLTSAVLDAVSQYTEFTLREEQKFRAREAIPKTYHPGPMFYVTTPCTQIKTSEALERLRMARKALCNRVKFETIDAYGHTHDLDEENETLIWPDSSTPTQIAAAISAVRSQLPRLCHARLVIGGKTIPRSDSHPDGYSGSMPGIIEEALVTVRAGQPLYIAGGFGGASALLAKQLDLPGSQDDKLPTTIGKMSPAMSSAIDEIRRSYHWRTDIGLSEADVSRLSRTHRPAELAGLIAKGLISLASKSTPPSGES